MPSKLTKTTGRSETPTPYAVECPEHGKVYLSGDNYMRQLQRPDDKWRCPTCDRVSEWDDDNYWDAVN